MSTQKLWDIHLKYDGVITDEFMEGNKKLAESIAECNKWSVPFWVSK